MTRDLLTLPDIKLNNQKVNTSRHHHPLDVDNLHVDDGVQHDVDDGKHLGDGGEVVPGIADCELPPYQHRDPLDDVDHEPDRQRSTGFFIFLMTI